MESLSLKYRNHQLFYTELGCHFLALPQWSNVQMLQADISQDPANIVVCPANFPQGPTQEDAELFREV